MGINIVSRARATHSQLRAKTGSRRADHRDRTIREGVRGAPVIANDIVPDLKIERIEIDRLKPAKRRIRKSSQDHVANVAHSLRHLGQVAPILIDREHEIVDGHVVVEALKLLGETHVSAVRLDHLTDDQIRLVQVALNKLAEGSTWDLGELKVQLEDLQLAGYDLTVTGFTLPEIDIVMQPEPTDVGDEQLDLLELSETPVSKPGDLWLLGEHRLLCGDALDPRSYATVLDGAQAGACFTDCPWNIKIEGFVSGLGSKRHSDFEMGAGEMTDDEFQDFVDRFTRLIADNLQDGGLLYSCIDWRSLDKIVLGGRRAGLTHINTIVWNKGSGGMGGLYRSAHELVPLFCKGKTPKTNNIELGRHGRDRTNVWAYPGANKPGSSAAKALQHHPTPKPVEMVEDALLDVTNRGELVLDPFLGSGTSLLAADRCGRVAAGIELDPAYVDVCIRRWEEMTGMAAVHADTDQIFSEICAIRREAVEEGESDHE